MKTKTKLAVFRNHYNYHEHFVLNDLEVPYGKSLTAPDQRLSVREQLARFNSGKINGLANPIFMEEDDGAPDFSKMDQIEIIQWREQALIEQQAIDDRFTKASQELAKKQDEARIAAAAAAIVASQAQDIAT